MIEFDFMKGSRRTKVSQVCWRTCCRNSVTWLLFLLTKCFFLNLKFLALCSNLVHNTDSYPIMTAPSISETNVCVNSQQFLFKNIFPIIFCLKTQLIWLLFTYFFSWCLWFIFLKTWTPCIFGVFCSDRVIYICLQSLPIVKSYINQHNMYKPWC